MIAYVDSPFQLLQCYELDRLGYKFTTIYIRLNGKYQNDKQLKNLITILDIKKANTIKIEKTHQKLRYYTLLFTLTFLNRNIVVGDANSFLFRLLSSFYKKEKFLLLDDGVATISNKSINKKFKRFTIFPKYVDNHIENQFFSLKKLIRKTKQIGGKHIIIGTKFVDEGICTQEVYIKAIRKTIQNMKIEDCLYIPHRDESAIEVQAIKQALSLNILRLKLPIELIFLETKIYPLSIHHILSTAAFSMNKLYEAPIYTCKIPSVDLLQRKQAIQYLYKIIESERITVFRV